MGEISQQKHRANVSMTHRDRPPASRVDPWAPGGTMSDPDRWTARADGRPANGDVAPNDRANERWGHSRLGRVAIVVALVASVAVVAGRARRTQAPPVAGTASDGAELIDSVETAVGRIDWTTASGESTSLPAGVVGSAGGRLIGRDDSGATSWVSSDGTSWRRDDRAGVIERAGNRWSVVSSGADRLLLRDDETSPAPVADQREARYGTLLAFTPGAADAADVVFEVNGETFARLDRHEAVDWRSSLDLQPGADVRIRVTSGDDEYALVEGAAAVHEAVELTARRHGDVVVVRNAAGAVVTTVGAVGTGDNVLPALRPQRRTAWARWHGDHFSIVSTPWSEHAFVEIAALDGRVIAVATSAAGDVPRAWTTTDGVLWEPAELPVAHVPGSPIPMAVGRDEVTLSISDGATTSHWSTTDGVNFEQLPDVAGIARRSRGSFGWIAPDPRGAPVVRISRDGLTWHDLDVSAQLGYDAARWDWQLDATAVGTEIYIVSTVGERRLVLVGTVDAVEAT